MKLKLARLLLRLTAKLLSTNDCKWESEIFALLDVYNTLENGPDSTLVMGENLPL